MKIVNRGFISVKPKQAFIDWARTVEKENCIDTALEANLYLVNEDFFEDEPLIESNFKKIFKNELLGLTDNEDSFPVINIENFKNWFETEIGNSVFDCESNNLIAD